MARTNIWDCFQLIPDEDTSEKWISFDQFIDFLRKHHIHSDSIKEIRKDNIWKSLQKHNNGVRTIQKKALSNTEIVQEKQVKFSSFLRFCFDHTDHLKVCKQVTVQVQACVLCDKQETSVDSLFDFYSVVSKSVFRLTNLEKVLLHSTHPVDIPCLFQIYESNFEREEWERIKIFEAYFWNSTKHTPQYDHLGYGSDVSVIKRWELFHQCNTVYSLKSSLFSLTNRAIKINTERKLAARDIEGVVLESNTRHLPGLLDGTIAELLEEYFPGIFCRFTCLDCLRACKSSHTSGIHVYLEVKDDGIHFSVDELFTLIQGELIRLHNERCVEVKVFQSGTFTDFSDDTRVTKRFHLRDAVSHGILLKRQLSYKTEEDTPDCHEEHTLCPTCSPVLHHSDPLDLQSFDIFKEWKFTIPLPFQIILETFINPVSCTRAQEQEKFVKEKLERLYLLFDSLLNTINKNYIGINQEINSDELSATYHSISSVFSVTSQGGLTGSLTNATERLQKQADLDQCYFNTFLKKFELDYQAQDGQHHKVSLQDCHIIFCLDNLVRLSFHRDPDRGDSRSSQICTLPMTVMGVPRDTLLLDSWHNDDICDGTLMCKCKETTKLTTPDLRRVFHDLTDEEAVQLDQLQINLTWHLQCIWLNIDQSALATQLENAVENAIPLSETSETTDDLFGEWHDSFHEDLDIILKQLDDEEGLLNSSLSDISFDSDLDSIPGDERSSDSDSELWFTNEAPNDELTIAQLNASMDAVTLESCQQINEQSDDPVPLCDDESATVIEDILQTMGYTTFQPPPVLIRHPPPAIGRDDDINKMREILDDILVKSGAEFDTCRVLFAPDNKIGKCLFKLMKEDPKYKGYLPEFPLLHLRKSKIVNLCSAYKDAGLFHLLSYMQDTTEDWKKLVSTENIESATHNIRRVSYSLHLAFMIVFLEGLRPDVARTVLDCLRNPSSTVDSKWLKEYNDFIKNGSKTNATFALHAEMMSHCDEIIALAIAERIGGPTGYNLMLGVVKSSLPFSFLTGASSYGAFCCQLLYEHYSCGHFHQKLKQSFFSTPYKGSNINFALDSQREMEHRDALKGFRPRSTVTSVLPRMSLVDRFNDVESFRKDSFTDEPKSVNSRTWRITLQDLNHIYPTAALILRQGGLEKCRNPVPKNVYASSPTVLPESSLDQNSFEVGRFLIDRFVFDSGLHYMTSEERPIFQGTSSSTELVKKVKNMKSVTVRRMNCKSQNPVHDKSSKEIQRKKRVKSLLSVAECLSSEMNTCQAVVKPDCSKPTVQKSSGMKKALLNQLKKCLSLDEDLESTNEATEEVLRKANLVQFGLKDLTSMLHPDVVTVVVEFAGQKFKTQAKSGEQYVKMVEHNVINRIIQAMPSVQHIVLCEEKYKFAPAEFKAATKCKRRQSQMQSVCHLKRGEEIISSSAFDKRAVLGTEEGRSFISSFLAKHTNELNIKRNLILDIDSEWITDGCICDNQSGCNCATKFAVPLRTVFSSTGQAKTNKLAQVKQRKGEAEMSQIDWISYVSSQLGEKDEVASIVTSGDIDSIPIHLFSLSLLWPRNKDNKFKNKVLLILQKPGSVDLYNITTIIELLESQLGNHAGLKIAMGLCMGGNDYLPKYFGISHDKILRTFVDNKQFFQHLFTFDEVGKGYISRHWYHELMKTIYCPNTFDPQKLQYHEVRQMTIKHPKRKDFARPQLWLPPQSALSQICLLLEYQMEYLYTAGDHSAHLPDFLKKGCIRRNKEGEMEYYLGEEVRIKKPDDLLHIPESTLLKRLMDSKLSSRKSSKSTTSCTTDRRKRTLADTPQKGARRKQRQITSTPRK